MGGLLDNYKYKQMENTDGKQFYCEKYDVEYFPDGFLGFSPVESFDVNGDGYWIVILFYRHTGLYVCEMQYKNSIYPVVVFKDVEEFNKSIEYCKSQFVTGSKHLNEALKFSITRDDENFVIREENRWRHEWREMTEKGILDTKYYPSTESDFINVLNNIITNKKIKNDY